MLKHSSCRPGCSVAMVKALFNPLALLAADAPDLSSAPPLLPVKSSRQLQEHDQLFRELVQSVKDYAIFMLDPAGHVATWNAGAERIKGYTAEEIIGRHFSRFYPPEEPSRGAGRRTSCEVARERGPVRGRGLAGAQGRHALLGQRRHHRAARRDGRLHGFAKVTRDLTERRQHRGSPAPRARASSSGGSRSAPRSSGPRTSSCTRRSRAATELEAELRDLGGELAKQIGDLGEADRRKDEFLAMLAHELRNPLAPIRNALEILKLPSDDGDAPRASART